MERYFILDKFNTWYDWRLILTEKDITPPKPKTNYLNIDGASGSLDLSEALTGEVTYSDCMLSATFWTDQGNRTDRERLLRDIKIALHGRKVKIVEPDDPDHYLLGRIAISGVVNNLAYMTFKIEATCEPWRYALEDVTRTIDVKGQVNAIMNNHGVKSVSPEIEVDGRVVIEFNRNISTLTTGRYKIPELKLRHGVNVITLSGNGSVTFTYREADL